MTNEEPTMTVWDDNLECALKLDADTNRIGVIRDKNKYESKAAYLDSIGLFPFSWRQFFRIHTSRNNIKPTYVEGYDRRTSSVIKGTPSTGQIKAYVDGSNGKEAKEIVDNVLDALALAEVIREPGNWEKRKDRVWEVFENVIS